MGEQVFIFQSKNHINPPPSENYIFPLLRHMVFKSYCGFFGLILPYFAFILPFYFPFSLFLFPFFPFLLLSFSYKFPPFSLPLFIFVHPISSAFIPFTGGYFPLQATSEKVGKCDKQCSADTTGEIYCYTYNIISVALHPALIGEAGPIPSTKKDILRLFFFICCFLHISGTRIAVQVVFEQHKGHKRICKAWKCFRCASPIVTELA